MWAALKLCLSQYLYVSKDPDMENTGAVPFTHVEKVGPGVSDQQKSLIRARRTAFTARFIVLRESKRSRAHRVIEMMEWDDLTTAEELHQRFRQAFVENKDNMGPVDRDLRRAMGHADRSLTYFIKEYEGRSTNDFIEALNDYERSNALLFGDDDQPKPGGWRLPRELVKLKSGDVSKKKK